ncbi:hypothetical protein BDY19DRAFT_771849 [Irpex rosettiformis]|uniref:Uncharacterized protein n=1 Tax=Irpex rosettiformis TaxID=378272 RepID=A0ACB8U8I5_9APHY|nr:hypothetical protein BDY19DRAFT_771849 [Irpex rosettiformis]
MATPPTSRPTTSAGARPSNDDIEAVIQMATSTIGGNGHLPPRDTRTQLFVGNLPYRVRWQDLKDLFRRAGTILRADVSLAPDNRSRGYGTVLLATAEDAGRAVDMFNGFVWQTRTLEVRLDRMAGEDHQMQPQGLSGGVGLSTGLVSANGSGSGTPFAPRSARMPSSPTLFPLDDRYLKAASPIAGLASPTAVAAQLTGSLTPLSAHLTGGGGERSRNLFVGNLPFHIQWQDLKDLFRQAGTILRADVALGPDGRSRGFGTVVFATELDAERGVRMFNG